MILELFRLDGRTAVVTGARRGLGQAFAVGLAQAGANIVSIGRSDECEETCSQVELAGRWFRHFDADLSRAESRAGLIEGIEAAVGPLHILVNNAGQTARHPPETFPLDEWSRIMELHVTATFDLSQQAARQMLARGEGGKIINLGSVMSFQGGFQIPAYAAAKHAVAGLTKSLANAWSRHGINVNCIAPGYMETEMSQALQLDPVRGPQILDRIPSGRWGRPEELAGTVVFLASAAASYLHGAVIPVDGGWLAR